MFSSTPQKNQELKAFITSAYFYPTSKSLGDNSLALVMSINLGKSQEDYMEIQQGKPLDEMEISVYAKNETSAIIVNTNYMRITPHDYCQMITVFATIQLIPNVHTIHLVSDDGSTKIPFSLASYEKHDVVVCASPIYVYEQWQNFLLAVHVYKKFGAFLSIYFISCVSPLFMLLQKYEKSGYLNLKPWYRANFPQIPPNVADPFAGIEFQNHAAAHTDCLLQYKESAKFVAFLDLDSIIFPKIAPTYVEEFQKMMMRKQRLAYLIYRRENYGIMAARKGMEFSIKTMLNSLTYKNRRETIGTIIADPRYVNYTWIHPSPFSSGSDYFEVTENSITHLENIRWTNYKKYKNEPYYLDTTDLLISTESIQEIETDFQDLMKTSNFEEILPTLPNRHYYAYSISKCLEDNHYNYLKSGKFGKIRCPGPQTCKFKQMSGVMCVHVNAQHHYMVKRHPITYYYATNPHYTSDIGCTPQ